MVLTKQAAGYSCGDSVIKVSTSNHHQPPPGNLTVLLMTEFILYIQAIYKDLSIPKSSLIIGLIG